MKKLFLVLCCFCIALSACSSFTNEPTDIGTLPEVTCVAVLATALPAGSEESFSATQKKSLIEGASYYDSVLATELGDRPEFKVLTEYQLDAILSNPWGGRLQQVRDLGKATGCEAVLEVTLSRYRERVGTEMSIETAASTAFSMDLIGVTRGVVLWSSSFDETQKALFDDIFSFGKARNRGFRWMSVQELSRDGLLSRLQEFPYFQEVNVD